MSNSGYSAESLLEVVKMISRAVDTAPVEVLEEAHALIEQHFLSVTASGTMENAAEQRVLGVLWAEVEMAIDMQRKSAARKPR